MAGRRLHHRQGCLFPLQRPRQDDGRAIIVAQNANRSGVAAPSWPFRDKQTVKLVLTFDGQAQFEVSGTAAHDKAVVGVLSSQAISAFRKAHQLVVTATNQTLQFDLAAAGDFSNSKAKPSNVSASAKEEDAPAAPSDSRKMVSVSGSGFVVSKNAHIVTNNHVVTDCVGDIHGNLAGQASVKLRVVSTDEENDLALLQGTKKFKEKDIATIRASAVNSGDQVVAIGYPLHGLLTSDMTMTTGIISSLAGVHNDTRFLQISAPVQPGNSGGPLHDSSGNIVGVVTAGLDALRIAKATGDIPQNVNFAIKTGALRDFLDNSAVPYLTAEPGSEMKTADIASAARTYTMLIACTARHGGSDRK